MEEEIPVNDVKLNGENYLQWSYSVQKCLRLHNKSQFLSDDPPNKNSPDYATWVIESSKVVKWLCESIERNLLDHDSYIDTAKKIWDVLKEKYSPEKNSLKICDLYGVMFNNKQGERSLDEYYNYMEFLWEELLKCQPYCHDSEERKRHQEQFIVAGLLNGLNSEYSSYKDEIFDSSRLITPAEAYTRLLQKRTHYRAATTDSSVSVDIGKKTGTTIVGIITKDGIVIAADKRHSKQNLDGESYITEDGGKVKVLGGVMVCAGAGHFVLFKRVSDTLSEELQNRVLSGMQPITVEQAANRVVTYADASIDELKNLYPNKEMNLKVNLLIGGYDLKNGQKTPSLCYANEIGSMEVGSNYYIDGSGRRSGQTFLVPGFRKDLSIDEAVQLARETILFASQHDSNTGSETTVSIIHLKRDRISFFNNMDDYDIYNAKRKLSETSQAWIKACDAETEAKAAYNLEVTNYENIIMKKARIIENQEEGSDH